MGERVAAVSAAEEGIAEVVRHWKWTRRRAREM